jgi:hypothetical protein
MKRALLTILALVMCLAGTGRADLAGGADHTFLWNRFNSVTVLDTLGLVTTDFGVVVFRVGSAARTVTVLGELPLGVPVDGAKIVGANAIVLSRSGIVYFVDISNPADLSLAGQIDVGSNLYDLTVAGQDLYLACGFDGVRHYRMTDFSDPVLIDSSLDGVHCVQVDVVDDHLLVLDDYNGVLRYDLSAEGLVGYPEVLWIPRRAFVFDADGDTLTIGLVGQNSIYRGSFDGIEPHLFDSLDLLVSPTQLFAIDTMIVAVDPVAEMLQVLPVSGSSGVVNYFGEWFGLETSGAVYYADSIPHLIMTSDRLGLAAYNLAEIRLTTPPGDIYGRPGPITGLAFHQNLLATGGAYNPSEFYSLDDNAFPSVYAGVSGLTQLDCMVDVGDFVVCYYDDAGWLSTLRLDGDSAVMDNYTSFQYTHYNRLRFAEHAAPGHGSFLLGINESDIELIRVRATGETALLDRADPVDDIIDAVVVDSLLLVSTVNHQLYVYKLYNNLHPVHWRTVSVSADLTHLAAAVRKNNQGGLLFPYLVFGFNGREMYELLGLEEAYPVTYGRGTMPVDVTTTAFGDDRMFTAGDFGLAIYDISQDEPELIESGGYGGHLLTYGDSTLAVSDGTAIHLYLLRGDGTAPFEDEIILTDVGRLHQNYPNPFNPQTRIDFDLIQSGRVKITVYDILGRRVANLVDEYLSAGPHAVEWDGVSVSGERVASGVYFYRMTTPGYSEIRKMVMLK